MFGYWRKRAKVLETALAEIETAHQALELIIADQAVLISLVNDGGVNRFTFRRNGELTQIETYGAMSDNINAWRAALLDRRARSFVNDTCASAIFGAT